jgi:4a-hydroxytetrahydrobiopterin dehydratase
MMVSKRNLFLIISSKRWDFMVQVGIVAEKQGHHQKYSMCIVNLRLTTHDAGGLTTKDFDLATAIEKLG